MDGFLFKKSRRQIKDLNVVPIIDMFTTVIFFLLLSTSFYAYTKITIPPAQISTQSSPVAEPPIAPKIIIGKSGDQDVILLTWSGKTPDQLEAKTTQVNNQTDTKAFMEEISKLIAIFLEKYPNEKTIQLGLTKDQNYQSLITSMDAITKKIPDIVLISYQEAQARFDMGRK